MMLYLLVALTITSHKVALFPKPKFCNFDTQTDKQKKPTTKQTNKPLQQKRKKSLPCTEVRPFLSIIKGKLKNFFSGKSIRLELNIKYLVGNCQFINKSSLQFHKLFIDPHPYIFLPVFRRNLITVYSQMEEYDKVYLCENYNHATA